MTTLNFRRLHDFRAVAKEGGLARAAERLDMAVQTISAQAKELERSLVRQMLEPQARGFALTEAGETAFARAEETFRIGQALPGDAREAGSHKLARIAVGLSDAAERPAAAVRRRQSARVPPCAARTTPTPPGAPARRFGG